MKTLNTNVLKVKPAKEGLIVRDPETKRPLPADGKMVRMSAYWIRRKIAGEIIIMGGAEEIKPDKKTIIEENLT